MAYNLAEYNLNPFNIAGDNVRYLRVIGVEEVTTSIGPGLDIYANAIGYERVNKTIVGVSARFIERSGTENITELVANGQPSVLLYPKFRETVTGLYHIDAEITPTAIASETVSSDAYLSALNYIYTDFAETVTAETHLSAVDHLSAEGYELVSESASVDVIETKTCLLTLTLAPGKKLIIDADSYTVILDGKNAIEKQSGDWIDELDRNTTDITIKAAAGVGNLSTSIIYTERYL